MIKVLRQESALGYATSHDRAISIPRVNWLRTQPVQRRDTGFRRPCGRLRSRPRSRAASRGSFAFCPPRSIAWPCNASASVSLWIGLQRLAEQHSGLGILLALYSSVATSRYSPPDLSGVSRPDATMASTALVMARKILCRNCRPELQLGDEPAILIGPGPRPGRLQQCRNLRFVTGNRPPSAAPRWRVWPWGRP